MKCRYALVDGEGSSCPWCMNLKYCAIQAASRRSEKMLCDVRNLLTKSGSEELASKANTEGEKGLKLFSRIPVWLF